MSSTLEGGCHCGRVRFRVQTDRLEIGERFTITPFDGADWEANVDRIREQ